MHSAGNLALTVMSLLLLLLLHLSSSAPLHDAPPTDEMTMEGEAQDKAPPAAPPPANTTSEKQSSDGKGAGAILPSPSPPPPSSPLPPQSDAKTLKSSAVTLGKDVDIPGGGGEPGGGVDGEGSLPIQPVSNPLVNQSSVPDNGAAPEDEAGAGSGAGVVNTKKSEGEETGEVKEEEKKEITLPSDPKQNTRGNTSLKVPLPPPRPPSSSPMPERPQENPPPTVVKTTTTTTTTTPEPDMKVVDMNIKTVEVGRGEEGDDDEEREGGGGDFGIEDSDSEISQDPVESLLPQGPEGGGGGGGGGIRGGEEMIEGGKFRDDEGSHFFAYFLTVMVTAIIFYLVFHNKQRILALIIEGRAPNGRRRRRNSSRARYTRLDNNLDEAITATRTDKGDHRAL